MKDRVEKLFMAAHERPPTDSELQRILKLADALDCKDNDAFIGVLAAMESYSTVYDTQIKKITDHCDIEARRAAKDAAEIAAKYAGKEAMRELVKQQNEVLREYKKKAIDGQKSLPKSSSLLVKIGAAALLFIAVSGTLIGEYRKLESDATVTQKLREEGFIVTKEGIAIPSDFHARYPVVNSQNGYIVIRY